MPSDSALVKTMNPRAVWSTESYLMAAAVDALNAANWQRAGKKGNPRPKPIQRPGDDNRTKYQGSSMTLNQFDAAYARARENAHNRENAGEVVWQSK